MWKLTFDPGTATVSNPVPMAPGSPLADQKANGLVLDPTNDALYVGDLIDGNIRRISGVNGDPRLTYRSRAVKLRNTNTGSATMQRSASTWATSPVSCAIMRDRHVAGLATWLATRARIVAGVRSA